MAGGSAGTGGSPNGVEGNFGVSTPPANTENIFSVAVTALTSTYLVYSAWTLVTAAHTAVLQYYASVDTTAEAQAAVTQAENNIVTGASTEYNPPVYNEQNIQYAITNGAVGTPYSAQVYSLADTTENDLGQAIAGQQAALNNAVLQTGLAMAAMGATQVVGTDVGITFASQYSNTQGSFGGSGGDNKATVTINTEVFGPYGQGGGGGDSIDLIPQAGFPGGVVLWWGEPGTVLAGGGTGGGYGTGTGTNITPVTVGSLLNNLGNSGGKFSPSV
jgi:hypothetical protein